MYRISNKEITLFFHVAKIGNWKPVKNEILDTIYTSGLNDQLSNLIINETDGKDFEYPTIEKIKAFSQQNPNQLVVYIHTKGVSKGVCELSKKWREWIVEFTIKRWRESVSIFNTVNDVDCTGTRLIILGNVSFYTGNFWWAKTDYINKLGNISDAPKFRGYRYNCESWLLSNPNFKAISLNNDFSDFINLKYKDIPFLKSNIKIVEKDNDKINVTYL